MMRALPYDYPYLVRGADDPQARVTRQTDVLVDAITGRGRDELEGLPVGEVYSCLCSQIRAMGLRPAESKVLRVAHWICGPSDDQHPSGAEAA